MGPVDDTPLGVPLVLTVEADRVSLLEGIDSLGKVNVVGHQQSLPGVQAKNESLVPAAVRVIFQYLRHLPHTFSLQVAGLILKGSGEDRVTAG